MQKRLNNSGIRYIVFTIIFVLIQSVLFFIAAGEISIPRFWFFVTVQITYVLFSLKLIYFKIPELLNSRGEIKNDSDKRDVLLVKIINIQMLFALPLIIGFDYRFNWSYLNKSFVIIGFMFYIMSNILVLSSMLVNKHFETNIRLQSDRDQKVIKVWPYSLIRHPGYTGTILWLIGVPMIMGSLIGLLFSIFIITGKIIRTNNEDKFLAKNLIGYKQYQLETKYKLIPGIW